MRSCIKTGCRWPAAATLSYRYASAEVWLSDLGDDHPATHDLCPHHADCLTVPKGWTLVDTRQPVEAPKEPSAAEIVERATRLREGVRSMLQAAPPEPPRPPSRYDALLDDLPSYAPEDEAAGERIGEHGRESVDAHEDDRPSRTLTRVAHELAPVIREMAADLSGTVVGTLQIDLEDRPGAQRDGQHRDQDQYRDQDQHRDQDQYRDQERDDTVTNDTVTNDTGVGDAVTGTVAPEEAAVVPPAPQPARREAVVVQLPLRTMDSSVD